MNYKLDEIISVLLLIAAIISLSLIIGKFLHIKKNNEEIIHNYYERANKKDKRD